MTTEGTETREPEPKKAEREPGRGAAAEQVEGAARRGGRTAAVDGPYTETKELIGSA